MITTLEMSTIDTAAWVSSERATVESFSAAQAQAQSNLATNVETFQKEVDELIQSEKDFSINLSTIAESIQDEAIEALLVTIQTTSTNVDSSYEALNAIILENNATAADIAAQMSAAGKNIEAINSGMSTLNTNIAEYTKVIRSFRHFDL